MLREADPDRRGMHYQDIAARIVERGHTISGRNKPANVVAHMSRSPSFESLGRGAYTWRPDASSLDEPSPQVVADGDAELPSDEYLAAELSDG